MMKRYVISLLVGMGVVAAPVTASAAQRAPAAMTEAEEIAGNPWIPILVGFLVAAIIIWQVVDDDPESP